MEKFRHFGNILKYSAFIWYCTTLANCECYLGKFSLLYMAKIDQII